MQYFIAKLEFLYKSRLKIIDFWKEVYLFIKIGLFNNSEQLLKFYTCM